MNQSNLILHCGAAKVERAQLTRIETPEGDRTWCPIPHETLVSEVTGALTRANMRIVTEAHGMSTDGLLPLTPTRQAAGKRPSAKRPTSRSTSPNPHRARTFTSRPMVYGSRP